MRSSGVPAWLQWVLVTALYAGAHYCARIWIDQSNSSLIWAPMGLGAAVLALTPPRRWWPYLLAFAAVNVAFNLSRHDSGWDVAVFLVATLAEMVVAAGLFRRWINRPGQLDLTSDAIALVVIGVGAAVLGAAVSTGLLGRARALPAPEFFFNWITGHYLSVIILVPLAFLVAAPEATLGIRGRRRRVETGGVYAVAIALTWASFHVLDYQSTGFVTPYLLFVVVIWSAIRLGALETATCNVLILVTMIVTFHTDPVGYPLQTHRSSLESAQQFLAVLTTTGFLLAAFAKDRSGAYSSATKSEAWLRLIFENAADALAVLDAQGFVMVNSPFLRLFGPAGGDGPAEQPLERLFPAEARTEAMAHFERWRSGEEKTSRFETQGCGCDGRTVPLEVSYVPFTHAEERYLLATFHDLTEARRVQEARTALEEQLRQSQKLEAVGRLAGGVAHDFNNILTGMLLNLQTIEMAQPMPAGLRGSLNELTGMVRRAAGITDQLLVFARRNVMRPMPLELNAVVADGLKLIRRLLGEHIAVAFRPSASPLHVQGDFGMLHQVVLNFSINARDAMPSGGELTFETSLVQTDGLYACLSIRDTGGGIPSEVMPRIFEPFFTTKDVGKGTGLGLAIVHSIVKQHNGWIGVESTVGEGTTFKVYLPASEKPAEAKPAGVSAPLSGGPERILLVEDEPAVRTATLKLLERLGYRVEAVASAEQALTQWESGANGVDLLLTDMMMPGGMTGLQLAEDLRRKKPALKVLIMSGYNDQIMSSTVFENAGFAFLAKPFEVQALSTKIRQVLD